MRTNLLFDLVLHLIALLEVKLRVIHLCRCLVKLRLLIWTVSSIKMCPVCVVCALDNKVVIRESQSSCFKITLLIAIRAGHSLMLVVVIWTVLKLWYWGLLLQTKLFALSSIYFGKWTTEDTYWFIEVIVLLWSLLLDCQHSFLFLFFLITVDALQIVKLSKSTRWSF